MAARRVEPNRGSMVPVAVALVCFFPIPSGIGTEPLWRWEPSDIPLSVLIDAEMESWRGEVVEATSWWNKKLGKVVFLEVGVLGSGGLVVVAPYPVDDGMVGRAAKKGHTAVVRLVQDYPVKRQRSIRHELGHVLGLQHSKDIKSVMWPTVEDGDFDLLEEDKQLALEYLR